MLIMSLTTLVANAFIELNKNEEIRELKLDKVAVFDNEIKNYCENNNIEYISQLSSVYFYEMKFNYSMFFNVFEKADGYVVKLQNNISTQELIEFFRINYNPLLSQVLNDLNIKDIFCSKNKVLKK